MDGRLRRATEWVRSAKGDPGGTLIATFFHRENAYLMRITDGAFPYLQQIEVDRPRAYQPLCVPVAAALWLRGEAHDAGEERTRALATFFRSPVGALYRRDALLVYEPLEGKEERHHFTLSYPAGWLTMKLEFKTDNRFFPRYASLTTRNGLVHYRLAALEVNDPTAFDSN